MKYLPILEELFESDTIIFFIIGLLIAIIVGIKMSNNKKCLIGVVVTITTYLLCELISNIFISYFVAFLLLFIGTAAMGGVVGFIISCIINSFKRRQ